MRRLFTTAEAEAAGITRHGLAWAAAHGKCVSIGRGVYGRGHEPPSALDRERADVLRSGREARGHLAGVLLGPGHAAKCSPVRKPRAGVRVRVLRRGDGDAVATGEE